MSAALAAAFYSSVTHDQGAGSFYAAVSGRIYHGSAPENATLPLAVFTEREGSMSQMFGGTVRHRMSVEVEIFTTKDGGAEDAQEIDDKLFDAVDQARAAGVTGFDRATIQCTGRGTVQALEDAYSVTSTYSVDGTTT